MKKIKLIGIAFAVIAICFAVLFAVDFCIKNLIVLEITIVVVLAITTLDSIARAASFLCKKDYKRGNIATLLTMSLLCTTIALTRAFFQIEIFSEISYIAFVIVSIVTLLLEIRFLLKLTKASH